MLDSTRTLWPHSRRRHSAKFRDLLQSLGTHLLMYYSSYPSNVFFIVRGNTPPTIFYTSALASRRILPMYHESLTHGPSLTMVLACLRLFLWRRDLLVLWVPLLRHSWRKSVEWSILHRRLALTLTLALGTLGTLGTLALALSLHGHLALSEARRNHARREHTWRRVLVVLLGNLLTLEFRVWWHPHTLAQVWSRLPWLAWLLAVDTLVWWHGTLLAWRATHTVLGRDEILVIWLFVHQ